MFGSYSFRTSEYRLMSLIGFVTHSPARRLKPGPKSDRTHNVGYLYIHTNKRGSMLLVIDSPDGRVKDMLGTGRVPPLKLREAMVKWLDKHVHYVGDGSEYKSHRAKPFRIVYDAKRL